MPELLGSEPLQDSIYPPFDGLGAAIGAWPDTGPPHEGAGPLTPLEEQMYLSQQPRSAEVDDYGFDMSPWAGAVAASPMVELSLPVVDKTQAELGVPRLLGDMMQLARVTQEGILMTLMPMALPPTEPRLVPRSQAGRLN